VKLVSFATNWRYASMVASWSDLGLGLERGGESTFRSVHQLEAQTEPGHDDGQGQREGEEGERENLCEHAVLLSCSILSPKSDRRPLTRNKAGRRID
jgi:hypothetical protein